jgi:hypothetical protein
MSETGSGHEEEMMEDEGGAASAATVLEERTPPADAGAAARRGSAVRSAAGRLRLAGEEAKQHDLAPIHSMLLDLAISLQFKVNLEIQNIGHIRRRLALEM